jgi:peptidoglycan/LPS O-acetylase OafA/YrhL
LRLKNIKGGKRMGAPTRRLQSVDFLRGIAVLGVITLHARLCAWIGLRQEWERFRDISLLDHLSSLITMPLVIGGLRVPLFFVISGYLIHISQARSAAHAHGARLDARNFYWRRFFKIQPPLWVALLITLGFDALTIWHQGQVIEPSRQHHWTTAFGQILGMYNILVPTFGSNGALWTLALEIQFYAVYPLWLMARNRNGWTVIWLTVLPLALISGLIQEANGLKVFTTYFPGWLLGAWLAEVHQQGHRPFGSARRFNMAALVGCVVGALAGLVHLDALSVQAWCIPAAWLLDRVRNWTPSGWLVRCIAMIGQQSYSIYLLHVPTLLVTWTWTFDQQKFDSPLVALSLCIPCLLSGMLLYRLVEAPVNEAGKRWVNTPQSSTTSATGEAKA